MKISAASLEMFYLPEGTVQICFPPKENMHITTPIHTTEQYFKEPRNISNFKPDFRDFQRL